MRETENGETGHLEGASLRPRSLCRVCKFVSRACDKRRAGGHCRICQQYRAGHQSRVYSLQLSLSRAAHQTDCRHFPETVKCLSIEHHQLQPLLRLGHKQALVLASSRPLLVALGIAQWPIDSVLFVHVLADTVEDDFGSCAIKMSLRYVT